MVDAPYQKRKELSPMTRAAIGAGMCGLVGIIHGFADGSEYAQGMPDIAHEALNYAPLLATSVFTGWHRYMFDSQAERAGMSALAAAAAGGASWTFYWGGRMVMATLLK